MRKIYIIGMGAVGKSLAVALQRNNRDVCIIRGTVNDASSRQQHIRVESPDGNTTDATVEISSLDNFETLDGIVVLTNKSYGNTQLSKALKSKTGQSPLVILQNGLGVENAFLENYFPSVYRCVLFVNSQNLETDLVRFKPVKPSQIGVIQGDEAQLQLVVDHLTTDFFPFIAEQDIQPVIWRKAVINSVFNSICPLLQIDNGIFHRDENVMAIARRVIAECVKVANASGIHITVEECGEMTLQISRAADGQLISTLQDILHKRETEIETLNLEIVRVAASLNMEDSVRETKLLGELTLLKSILSR